VDDDLLSAPPRGATGVGSPWNDCDEDEAFAGQSYRADQNVAQVLLHYRDAGAEAGWIVESEYDPEPDSALMCLQRELDDGSRAYATLYLDSEGASGTRFSLELESAQDDLDLCSSADFGSSF
jgi:hypothetical protein